MGSVPSICRLDSSGGPDPALGSAQWALSDHGEGGAEQLYCSLAPWKKSSVAWPRRGKGCQAHGERGCGLAATSSGGLGIWKFGGGRMTTGQMQWFRGPYLACGPEVKHL